MAGGGGGGGEAGAWRWNVSRKTFKANLVFSSAAKLSATHWEEGDEEGTSTNEGG